MEDDGRRKTEDGTRWKTEEDGKWELMELMEMMEIEEPHPVPHLQTQGWCLSVSMTGRHKTTFPGKAERVSWLHLHQRLGDLLLCHPSTVLGTHRHHQQPGGVILAQGSSWDTH